MPPQALATVLVVDDEHGILETLAAILKWHGFTVFTARSGEEAVDIASGVVPDWVVSDVVMRTLNGVDAAIKIRELCPETRILLFSGNALTTDFLAEARVRGHNFEILAKPFDPLDLIQRLTAPESLGPARDIAS